MSMPASRCLANTWATRRSTSASSALPSTASPSSDLMSNSLSGPPRGRLPTWVTRSRSSLLRIVPLRARGSRARPASRYLGGGGRLLLRPIVARRLGDGKLLGVLVTRRHRGGGGCHHLMVIDVEEPQPALLAEREPDHAAELDQLGLGEVLVHAVPERIVGFAAPDDRLGIGERRLLSLVVFRRRFEIDQVPDVILDQGAAPGGLLRALVAAIFALHRARDVEPAQLLDGMIEHAVVEEVAPRIGEEPERGRHVRAHRGALRPRRSLALATPHLFLHGGVHLLERDVADALLGH